MLMYAYISINGVRFYRMSEYIHKSHNVTVLLYHIVLPAKYRRAVFDDRIDFYSKGMQESLRSARY